MGKDKRVYMSIGEGRGFNIKVLLDDRAIYEGSVEDASEEIKKMKYSKIKTGNINTYWVYSEFQ